MPEVNRELAGPSLDDRVAILNMLGLYVQLVDNGDWEHLGDVFTSDATLISEGGGHSAPIPVESFPTILPNNGRALNPHHHTDTVLHSVDADTVRAWSKFFIVRADGTAGSGDYLDTVVRTSEGWRIAQRAVSRGNRPASDPTGGASQRTFTAELWRA